MAQQLLNAVVLASIYTLFALGITLSWGVLNVLNLAHGAIFMSGALVAWLITEEVTISIAFLLPLAAVASGTLSVLVEWLVFRPIRRRYPDPHAAELAMVIASIGVSAIPITVALRITHDEVKSLPDSVMTLHTWDVLGLQVSNIMLLIVVLAVALSSGLAVFIRRSKYGHALRALAYDPGVCGLMGISNGRLATITMFVSGGLAGIAGVLLALQLGAVEARMGEPLLLKAFAVITLAGVGSLGGAMVAALLLAVVETMMIVYVDPGLKDAVAFGLIILLLLIRPQGLFSRLAWERA